jgi:hypothetical protein
MSSHSNFKTKHARVNIGMGKPVPPWRVAELLSGNDPVSAPQLAVQQPTFVRRTPEQFNAMSAREKAVLVNLALFGGRGNVSAIESEIMSGSPARLSSLNYVRDQWRYHKVHLPDVTESVAEKGKPAVERQDPVATKPNPVATKPQETAPPAPRPASARVRWHELPSIVRARILKSSYPQAFANHELDAIAEYLESGMADAQQREFERRWEAGELN